MEISLNAASNRKSISSILSTEGANEDVHTALFGTFMMVYVATVSSEGTICMSRKIAIAMMLKTDGPETSATCGEFFDGVALR